MVGKRRGTLGGVGISAFRTGDRLVSIDGNKVFSLAEVPTAAAQIPNT